MEVLVSQSLELLGQVPARVLGSAAGHRTSLRRDLPSDFGEEKMGGWRVGSREVAADTADAFFQLAETDRSLAGEAYIVGKIDLLTLLYAATDLDQYQREAAMRASGTGRVLAALQKGFGLPLIPGTPDSETPMLRNRFVLVTAVRSPPGRPPGLRRRVLPVASDASPGEPQVRPTGAPCPFSCNENTARRAVSSTLETWLARPRPPFPPDRRSAPANPGARQGADSPNDWIAVPKSQSLEKRFCDGPS